MGCITITLGVCMASHEGVWQACSSGSGLMPLQRKRRGVSFEVVASLQIILSGTLACSLFCFHLCRQVSHSSVLISVMSLCRDGVHPVTSGLAAAVLGQYFLSSQQQQVGAC